MLLGKSGKTHPQKFCARRASPSPAADLADLRTQVVRRSDRRLRARSRVVQHLTEAKLSMQRSLWQRHPEAGIVGGGCVCLRGIVVVSIVVGLRMCGGMNLVFFLPSRASIAHLRFCSSVGNGTLEIIRGFQREPWRCRSLRSSACRSTSGRSSDSSSLGARCACRG